MSKFLHKVKDAMTGGCSKSKRRGDGFNNGGPYSTRDSNPWDEGRNTKPGYRNGDYGTRFESYGSRLRRGTYGSGGFESNTRYGGGPGRDDYGSHGNAAYSRPGKTQTSSSATGSHGSGSGARARHAFAGGEAARSSSYKRTESGYPDSGYASGDTLNSHIEPISRAQRWW
ncbi:uncharacterized protein BJX67DRAFT_45396 [Aspergillus lucknowensis]|uniref:Uncharacterized protein n=1 Tax=Aspergillus lucknowensis TaxID=176173 RepID=A0ABR4LZ40_9EURO